MGIRVSDVINDKIKVLRKRKVDYYRRDDGGEPWKS
jgi:hypothetical protein